MKYEEGKKVIDTKFIVKSQYYSHKQSRLITDHTVFDKTATLGDILKNIGNNGYPDAVFEVIYINELGNE